ncbi:MAG TPA: exonuclease SbcCD subunit D [Anaerolineales bacterium]|nr:exonuclease SbcCD subunit D [Anaerolineales bacterium]
MPSILHFADAHIDMANYGRHDPNSGLPMRVIDFLKSLDIIVDTAIQERVDLVLFAGDAYKDRNPAPTFQREWGRRLMRLSRAGIPTLLLVGNHDLSPALGRAHALETFDTLEVPHVRVLDKPAFLGPADLEGLPLQVLALPWIARSGLMAALGLAAVEPARIYEELEKRLTELVHGWLEEADAALPTLLTAHASVQGAVYGGERTVMLGGDLVLSGSLVRDPRLDYVALGHIHKPQNLNENAHPPVIYPGSIERVDFGEAGDDKFFVIAHLERGRTEVEWRKLAGIRPFVDRFLRLESQGEITSQLLKALPEPAGLEGAIVRLVLEYPRDWEAQIDESALREHAAAAFEFHLVKRPQMEARIRLPDDQALGSLTPLELLDIYWRASHTDPKEVEALQNLAAQLIHSLQADEKL